MTLAFFLIAYALIYHSSIKPALSDTQNTKRNNALFIFLIAFAIIIRFITASFIEGFSTDISCFKAWSQMVYSDGFSKFYLSDALTDYPPGYMYVLYIIGAIRNLFHLSYNSDIFTFIIKTPAIICDIVAAVLIYNTANASKKTQAFAISCAAIYLLNPAVIINSSAWGQVDSVYTVFVVLFICFLYKQKFILSCVAFTVGFLFKPQIIIFAPIIGCYFLYELIVKKDIKNIVLASIKALTICLSLFFIAILPFCENLNFTPVLSQYLNTISSYPYACVNAYNFFMITGGNWVDINTPFIFLTYGTWSWVFICLAVIFCLYIFFKSKDKNIYFQLGAFIITAIFTFAAKMHERYVFPAMILLIFAFLHTKNKKFLHIYLLMSITQFLSVAYVLYMDIVQNTTAMPDGPVPYIISAANIGLFIYLCSVLLKQKSDAPVPKTKFSLQKSKVYQKFTRTDYIIMATVTVIYSALAFFNLGDIRAADTHTFIPMGTSITFEFDEDVTDVKWYNGYLEERSIGIYSNGEEIDSFDTDTVFAWHSHSLSESKNIEMYFYSDTDITEISFSSYEKTVAPTNVFCSDSSVNIANLTDESHLVPKTISYKNSTYFDEIYHARTAYEYIHSLTPYENTHPPLGKLLISLGILIFGMTPFGWRFLPTLCGIIMLPVMYVFAKKMFNSRKAATFAILLTALDFMHFTQTRIATIDVFVTLFIILAYFFMYKYVSLSFYDTPIFKTFIPLGLSGLFFALAVASKWTGVYAGAGLCVIFFISIIRRIYEYVKVNSAKSASYEDKKSVKCMKQNVAFTLLFCICTFVILPLLIYIASYIPYLKAPGMDGIKSIIENQKSMFDYHSNLTATHPYSSFWYQWPFITRPVWYYTNTLDNSARQSIAAFGNPAVWWFGIIALFIVVLHFFKRNSHMLNSDNTLSSKANSLFIPIAFAAQFLPWIGVTRCVFLYHYFPCVPFIILAICFFINSRTGADKKTKISEIVYLLICFALFVIFYPSLSATGVSENYLSALRWFPTWYF